MARFDSILRSLIPVGLALLSCCSEPSDPPVAAKASTQEAAKAGPAGAAKWVAEVVPGRTASSSDATRPISDRGLLGRVSESSLFVLRFPQVELLAEALKRSVVSRLLENPAAALQLQQARSQLGAALAELEAKTPEAAEIRKCLSSLRGEVVFAIENLDPTRISAQNGGLPFSIVLFYDAGDRAAELKHALEPLLARKAGDPSSGVTQKEGEWGFELRDPRARLAFACVENCFELRIDPTGSAPRARRELAREDSFLASELVRSSPDLAKDGATPCAEMYWNLAPLWTIARSAAPADVMRAISECGLDKIAGVSLVTGLAPKGLHEVLTVHSPGGEDILSRAVSAHALSADLARQIPADASNAALFSFDLARLFEDVRAAVPPEARAELESAVDTLRTRQGFDLRRDVLENFGPTFALATQGDLDGGSSAGTPGVVLLAEVRDSVKARRAIERSGIPIGELESSSSSSSASFASAIDWEKGASARPQPSEPAWALGEHFVAVASEAALARQSLRPTSNPGGPGAALARAAQANKAGDLWWLSVSKGIAGTPDTITSGRRTPAGLVIESRDGAGALSGGLVGGLGVLTGFAIPKLFEARLSANEAAAISTLRCLSSAQAQLQSAGALDTDNDGIGEYGYMAELAGAQPVRIGVAGVTKRGAARVDQLEPAVLSSAFGNVNSEGQVARSGYLFQIWLPSESAGGKTWGITEDGGGGKAAGPFPNADNGEVLWCCYAWPIDAAETGSRCFFINQEGDILQTANRGPRVYSGATGGPSCYAAYSVANDMDSPVGVGTRANDGNVWSFVQ